MWVAATASCCSCQKLLYSMPDVSVAVLATACSVCHSKAPVPAEVDLISFLPFGDFSVCLESDNCAESVLQLSHACSCFPKNISFASTHIQQTTGSGHFTATLTSIDTFCKNLSGRGMFQDHLSFLQENKAEYRLLNIDTRNASIYSQTSLNRKTSNWRAIRKK